MKFVASMLGMCKYEVRLPLTKINKENENKLKEEVENLSLTFS